MKASIKKGYAPFLRQDLLTILTDSLLDRRIHNAQRVLLKRESLRKKQAKLAKYETTSLAENQCVAALRVGVAKCSGMCSKAFIADLSQ